MGKPLTLIVPDFREALEEGVQQATKTVVRDLQIAGPYWTGFFSDVWQVNVGKTAVRANIQNPLEVLTWRGCEQPLSRKEITTLLMDQRPLSLMAYTLII